MEPQDNNQGLERRAFLKRAAVVTGATVWATPTVQSLVAPAFATGTALCPPERLIRFKYDVDNNLFDSGDASGGGASWCLPDGYATAGNPLNGLGNSACITVDGKQYCVTVSMSVDGKSANVSVTGGAQIEDLDAKAGAEPTDDGNPKNDGECVDANIDSASTASVSLDNKEISFVAGVLCI